MVVGDLTKCEPNIYQAQVSSVIATQAWYAEENISKLTAELLVALASTVVLGSESHRTHDPYFGA
jgi:hypothetical protein